MAADFLRLLDPSAERWTFQTFDDLIPKRSGLAKAPHLHFDAPAFEQLTALNARGAGVFVMVNTGDGVVHVGDDTCRTSDNVLRVRALFVDLDGAPLEPVFAAGLKPHIVVESSPGRWHCYWRVDDCPLEQFKPLQQKLAAKFGGDKIVNDLCRVLRLPGFVHMKGNPFRSRLLEEHCHDAPAYTVAEICEGLGVSIGVGGASRLPSVPDGGLNSELMTPRYQVPEYVGEGERNNAQLAYAGHLRGTGASQATIERAVLEFNKNRCQPPLPTEEALDLARRYARDDEPSEGAVTREVRETFNDASNADRFIRTVGGGLRFVSELGVWLIWNDGHWRRDSCNQIITVADNVARRIFNEARDIEDTSARVATSKWANASLQLPRLSAMVTLAQPAAAVGVNELDANPMLLGVLNGVVDLRTGAFREAQPADLITKLANVTFVPEATCPTWEAAINTWTGGDVELAGFLQRIAGYCLTGSTEEQVFFFLYGRGRNGKSVFVNVVRELMGANAMQSQPEVLMQQRGGNASGPTPEIARLAGVRMVAMVETEDGQRLAEARVKAFTGGDAISARMAYGVPFDFVPKAKLVLAGNHKPIIRGDDLGIWRRVVLVPFTVEIPEDQVDRRLPDKLRAEFPGILRWAIEGCQQWQERKSLAPPACVTREVAEYKSAMDILAAWIDEACTVGPRETWGARDAYHSFSQWATSGGYGAFSEVRFAQKMGDRGFAKSRTGKGAIYTGLGRRNSLL